MIRSIGVLLLVLCFSGVGSAQRPRQQHTRDGVSLVVELSSSEAQVAAPMTLRLQVDAPVSSVVTMPLDGSQVDLRKTLGAFRILNTQTTKHLPVDDNDSMRRWISVIQLDTIETGELEIPSLEVAFRLKGATTARQGTIRSEPISVLISSVLKDSDTPMAFRDIKPAADRRNESGIRSGRYRWLFAIAAITLSALVAVMIRRRKEIPANSWAASEIERIENSVTAKTISMHDAFAQLSVVLRRYLQLELGIPATALSSNELALELSAIDLPDTVVQKVKAFTEQADVLKFASQPLVADEAEPWQAVRGIVSVVHSVRPGGNS